MIVALLLVALAGPLPQHPRLLWPASETAAVRERVEKNPRARALMRDYKRRGEELLTTRPVTRQLEGRRLLGVSRTAIDRITLLAFVYRATGDKRFAVRAERELLAVAEFSDWHPEHFLDVAEMTAGAAIGYDWLYDALSAETRAKVSAAIRTKGLEPVFGKEGTSAVGRTNNWNAVCNGGATLGALAVHDDDTALATKVLDTIRANAPKGMLAYEPDGAYPEGPSYWDYGTTYAVLMIEALRYNLHDDFGLASGPGFNASADFMVQATGPSGKQFNYSDGSEKRGPSVAMAWFGYADDIAGKPGRFDPLRIVWLDRIRDREPPPLTWQSKDVAFVRSGWGANDLFVGIKAGRAGAPHGHMDAGSFVLDRYGVRWVSDLDKRDYNALESAGVDYWNMKQDATRWQVFETGPFSHNTITVNGALHDVDATATFVKPLVVDMKQVLGVEKARRTFRTSEDTLYVTDEITAAANADIRWAMTTRAKVTILNQRSAKLELDGKRLFFELGPSGTMSVEELTSNKPPYRVPVPGYRQIVVHTKADAQGDARIDVAFMN